MTRPRNAALDWARRYPCRLPPAGWWCSRGHGHNGPCAARPCWWNLRDRFAHRDALMAAGEPDPWILVLGLVLVLVAATMGLVTGR